MPNKPAPVDPYSAYQQPLAAQDPYAAYQQPLEKAPSRPMSPAPPLSNNIPAPSSWSQRILGVNPITDTLTSVGSHLKNLVTAPIHAFADPLTEREKADDHGDGMLDNPILRGVYRMTVEPTAQSLADAWKLHRAGGAQASLTHASSYDAAGNNVPTAGSKLVDSIPIYGAWSRSLEDEAHNKGFVPAMAGLATDIMAPHYAGKLPGIAAAIPDAIRRTAAPGLDTPLMDSGGITPRQRYDVAKHVGVNLDLADATNSPPFTMAKKVNEGGVISNPTYEAHKAGNVTALRNYSDTILNGMTPLDAEAGGRQFQGELRAPFNEMQQRAGELLNRMSPLDADAGGRVMQEGLRKPFIDLQNRADDAVSGFSPLDREQGGARLQDLLKADQDSLHQTGSEQEQAIRDAYGDLPLKSLNPMRSMARTILGENGAVDELVPHLAQKQIKGVMQDIAKIGTTKPKTGIQSPLERAQEMRGEVPLGPPEPMMPVRNALEIRSRLIDAKKNPNELVAGAADADLERQIAATHEAVGRSLPTDGRVAWERANGIWKDMKETYDDPSSPFYHAVRTPSPSTLVDGIGGRSPEAVEALRTRAGEEGVGIVRRGVAEKMLGRTGSGEYDLNGFGARLERTPEVFRNALYGNEGHEELRGINSAYQDVKPYVNAAYTNNPEALVKGVGSKTAAGVQHVRPLLGDAGMGAMRRGVATDLLGTTESSGEYNLGALSKKLERVNEGYRSELFGSHDEALDGIASDYRFHEPYRRLAFDVPPVDVARNVERTAENVRKLRSVVGDDAMGTVQRGVAENMLGTDKDGEYNLPRFGKNLHGSPEDFRRELFQEHHTPLTDVATTANTISKDFNPSGSAKQGQKVFEAAKIATGIPFLQWPVAKFMTNPQVVDWFMKSPSGPTVYPPLPYRFSLPAGGAVSAAHALGVASFGDRDRKKKEDDPK